ncbi:MAG: hypothetical protein J5I93_23590 [Pirellulaceae bacterium]|nr:hypothetical protein [Pirellulaceae bacterium]
MWLVSTRHLGCPGPADEPPALEVQQYLPGAGWQSSDLPALLDAQSRADRTCVYVHGNRVEWNEALSQGQGLYRRLLMADNDAPPACFVIWSWPSSQIRGQLKDVRVKAARTNSEGYYLGWLLSALDPDRPLSLIGYSFGARVITGALHLHGGGALAGRTLPSAAGGELSELTGLSARVALLAPAVHNDWLSPGHRHELAAYDMDSLLLLYNSCDQALKRYGLTEKGAHPDALGYTGLVYRTPLEPDRITQVDACCIVGKAHDEWRYYNAPSLMRRIRAHALWTDD